MNQPQIGAQLKLKKIDLAGGAPVELADAISPPGGAWNRDGVILFPGNPNSPLMRIGADGGTRVGGAIEAQPFEIEVSLLPTTITSILSGLL